MSTSPTTQIVSLNQFRLLKVEGPDSERFLQGQLTCDVVKLADQHWELGACCTAKGRMVANFLIARSNDAFWLRLPAAQAEALKNHLSRYAVFYKTSMSVDERPLAGHLPANLTLTTAAGQHPLTSADDQLSLQWPDGRVEVWGEASDNDGHAWTAQDLATGLVWVEEASREAWVPQYIDWQIQGGVNFKKGCYTGQEIVARLQYLGKSKKQLAALSATSALELQPLQAVTDSSGKTIGDIAAWDGQQGLAVLQVDSLPAEVKVGENTLVPATLFYTELSNETDTPPAVE